MLKRGCAGQGRTNFEIPYAWLCPQPSLVQPWPHSATQLSHSLPFLGHLGLWPWVRLLAPSHSLPSKVLCQRFSNFSLPRSHQEGLLKPTLLDKSARIWGSAGPGWDLLTSWEVMLLPVQRPHFWNHWLIGKGCSAPPSSRSSHIKAFEDFFIL